MITLKEDTEVVGIWFCGNAIVDFLGQAQVENGKITAVYRFRYHVDDKAFDSKDNKQWYILGPIEDNPGARERLKETMHEIVLSGIRIFGMPAASIFPGGTGTEAIEWLKKQDFVHMRVATEADKAQYIKH